MTQHTAEFMDVSQFVLHGKIPQRPLTKKSGEVWHVRATPLDFKHENHAPTDWTLVREGEIIRIPLCPYRTLSMDMSQVLLSAFDLGHRFAERYNSIVRSHIIIGQPVEDLRPDVEALRYWIGYAVQIR
jgi:hypothetical protein